MTEASTFDVPADVGNPLRRLARRYARPHALRYAVAAVGTLLAQIPQRLPAVVVGVALDAILYSNMPYTLPIVPNGWLPATTQAQVRFTVVLLAGAYILSTGLRWGAGRISATARLRTLYDVRVDVFETLLAHDLAFFNDHQTGDVISVLNNDVGNLDTFSRQAFEGVRLLAQILVAFAFMAALDSRLAAVLIALPVAIAGLSRWYTTRVEPICEGVRESVGRVNSRLADSVGGIATVKSFAREDDERDAIAAASREYRDRNWSIIRLRLLFDTLGWTASSVAFIGVFVLGSSLVLYNRPTILDSGVTSGSLLTFLLYTRSFYGPIRQLVVDVLDSYENALASGKRVVSILDGDQVERVTGREFRAGDGCIEYDDVSFRYAGTDELTLSGIEFTAEPGTLVGVVGPTGAGKSTLAKLLFRFYDPDSGTVRIDGQDVTEVSRASLREHLGYVSQDPFLFYGTIRENVAYGADDANDEAAVVEAAKLAGAHEFVTDLPEGYDTQVGERGVKLSGGQRQRIAIARALFRDPEILVLDEATSHVDNETEALIQQNIDDLAGERTTIAIAHRLSTVRNADQILVLKDGQIEARGTHEDLLDANDLYTDLWNIQVGKFDAVSASFLAADDEIDAPGHGDVEVLR